MNKSRDELLFEKIYKLLGPMKAAEPKAVFEILCSLLADAVNQAMTGPGIPMTEKEKFETLDSMTSMMKDSIKHISSKRG